MAVREPSLLTAEHVTKRFGGHAALQDVSIEIRKNGSVGLLGQNGAGKSTLTKILVGVESIDEGKVTFRGQPFSPRNPLEAAAEGISIAYQDGATVPDLKVYQWMYLGRERTSPYGLLKTPEMKKGCASILEELGIECSPGDVVGRLPPVQRKLIEVAKAIDVSRGGEGGEERGDSLIILDEPTAPLTENERDGLYAKLKEVKKKSSFLLISHRISEVLEASDRVYVLKDGRNAGTFDTKLQEVTEGAVFRAMFGEDPAEAARFASGEKTAVAQEVLKVSNLSHDGGFQDVNLTLYAGEVLCLDGTPNSGKIEIARAIAGLVKTRSGTITKGGRLLKGGTKNRVGSGIGYFSGERSEELFLVWSVMRNITVTVLGSLGSRRWIVPMIDSSKEREFAKTTVAQFNIQPSNIDAPIRTLSGGNMQKVGLAKWLSLNPDVLILENPTVGIDTRTKLEIYQTLNRARAQGRSIILVSEDAEEVDRLSDRTLVIEKGRVSRTLTRETVGA